MNKDKYTSEPTKKNCDTPSCEKCQGRTALVSGYFVYTPDSEPYAGGEEVVALSQPGETWLMAFKCDSCGNVQGFWTE